MARLFILLTLAVCVGAAELPKNWRWINPLPSGQAVGRIRAGFGQYAAFGVTGAILDSTNGVDWTPRPPVYETIYDLAIGPNATVAVGRDGHILVSSDRISWQRASTPVASDISHVVYTDGKFVAWTTAGTQLESSTGAEWLSAGEVGFPVWVGNNVLITNGVTLLSEYWGSHALFDNGTRADIPYMGSVVYANGSYVGAGPEGLYVSANGLDWTLTQTNSRGYAVAFGNGIFLAATSTGFVASRDGRIWESLATTAPAEITSLLFGDGMFLAVNGEGMHHSTGVYTSVDGRAWTRRGESLLPTDLRVGLFTGLQLDSDENFLYVFDGYNILRSADLTRWEDAGASLASIGRSVARFARMPNGFLAGGDNDLFVKTENEPWRRVELPPNISRIEDVAFGNGVAVVSGLNSGYDPTLSSSADLTNWVASTSALDYWLSLTTVTFSQGMFMAHTVEITPTENAYLKEIRLSQDGRTWRSIDALRKEYGQPFARQNGKLIFATRGDYPTSHVTSTLAVTDENLNILEQARMPFGVQDMQLWNGSLIASGVAGALMASDNIRSLHISPGPERRLNITGLGGATAVRVEFSTNIAGPNWSLFTNTIAANLPHHVLPEGPAAFFRAVKPSP